MVTGKVLDGRPYVDNPHVRFDEGEVALAAMPRHGSLLYKRMFLLIAGVGMVAATFAENGQPNTSQDVKPVVRLSVAFMAIGDQDVQTIGNLPPDDVFQPKVVSNNLYDLIHGSNTKSNMAWVRASLEDTKRFFTQSGITRMSETGIAFIECGSKSGVKFKCGGTWFVKVGDGDTTDLKEIDYGITISANGGKINDMMLSLDFACDIRTIDLAEDGSFGGWMDDCSQLKIACPIGKTLLVRGSDRFGKAVPSCALPFFRSNPLMHWFMTDCGKAVLDRHLVIMICPEIVDDEQNVTPDDNKVVHIPMPKPNELDGGHECEACKKRGGLWSWLMVFAAAVVAALGVGYVVSSRRRASSMR